MGGHLLPPQALGSLSQAAHRHASVTSSAGLLLSSLVTRPLLSSPSSHSPSLSHTHSPRDIQDTEPTTSGKFPHPVLCLVAECESKDDMHPVNHLWPPRLNASAPGPGSALSLGVWLSVVA